METTFNIYTNENGKVTHAIYTDIHGAQRLYPYRRSKHGDYDNVSGNVTKRTLQRDSNRPMEEQLYIWK